MFFFFFSPHHCCRIKLVTEAGYESVQLPSDLGFIHPLAECHGAARRISTVPAARLRFSPLLAALLSSGAWHRLPGASHGNKPRSRFPIGCQCLSLDQIAGSQSRCTAAGGGATGEGVDALWFLKFGFMFISRNLVRNLELFGVEICKTHTHANCTCTHTHSSPGQVCVHGNCVLKSLQRDLLLPALPSLL